MPVSIVGKTSTNAQQSDIEHSTATRLLAAPTFAPDPEKLFVEPFVTIATAADRLGLKEYVLERCVRRGDVPHYTFYNSRKLVRILEIEAYVLASRKGGK